MKINKSTVDYIPVKEGEPVYFRFEEDFVSDNIRCIPMIVRFKLDACGIKLKLLEWSKFTASERKQLAEQDCSTLPAIQRYKEYLKGLILARTEQEATVCNIEESPGWAETNKIVAALHEQAALYGWNFSMQKWTALNNLQRFALLKLCRPGHENKSFPKAMQEFGMV